MWFAHLRFRIVDDEEGEVVFRAVGMDVHRDFCEVAIVAAGQTRSVGRIETTPAALEAFAASLAPTDRVALEVTGNAAEIARIIAPHVAQVVVVSPHDSGLSRARARPTGSTRARWRSCWRLASWTRSGCPMSGHGRCGGGCRGATSG
jgi:hypothetical protein